MYGTGSCDRMDGWAAIPGFSARSRNKAREGRIRGLSIVVERMERRSKEKDVVYYRNRETETSCYLPQFPSSVDGLVDSRPGPLWFPETQPWSDESTAGSRRGGLEAHARRENQGVSRGITGGERIGRARADDLHLNKQNTGTKRNKNKSEDSIESNMQN